MALIRILYFFVTFSFLLIGTNSQDSFPCSNSLCRKPSECENYNNGSYICHCRSGIKGKYCERLLENGENLCLSSPCWFGGTCIGNSTDWKCICPIGKTSQNCKNYINTSDLMVKVKNKGFYIAKLTLFYKRHPRSFTQLYQKTKSIAIGQDFLFSMPYDTDLTSAYLVAHAIAGIRIMVVNIETTPSCYHVWGTTLFPAWSQMPCW